MKMGLGTLISRMCPLRFSLRAWWGSAVPRMSLAFAARGMLAMLVPFVLLLLLGQPYGGVFAALGGMFAVLADTGGSYRRRLGAMLFALVTGSTALFVGIEVAAVGWLLPFLLAAIAFGSGMGRAFGGSGIAVGLSASILFLVGALSPGDISHPGAFVGYYALGNLWVAGVHLAQWRLRPYRILMQEIAACYDACAVLVAALERAASGADSAVARRRVRALHQIARERIRTAETTLESVRVGVGYSNPLFDRVQLLLSAVSREVIAATGLRSMDWPAPNTDAGRAWRALFADWRSALGGVSQLLLTGRGNASTAAMHAAVDALEAGSEITESRAAPLRLALLHMDAVAETGARVTGLKMTWRDALPRFDIKGLRRVWVTLAASFTWRSIIFRHALRVATAAGFGLWLAGVLDVPHRLWLPMTTILVLQPEFGATWRRLWQRVAGTLGGVLIAGALHFLVQDSVAEVVVIAVFAFAAFYFIRTAYGIGVIMLTPMILLLLGVLVPDASGMLIVARGIDTVLGGLLALVAAYALWPMWQRDAFLPQCATALRAERDYLALAFDQSGDGQLSRPELMHARHDAERAGDNADATLRRMLSEPAHATANTRAALGFMTYLRRLADNAAHFSVALAGRRVSPALREQGDQLLRRFDLIADVLAGRAESKALTTITPRLAESLPASEPLAVWFQRFAADTAMLAVETRRLARS